MKETKESLVFDYSDYRIFLSDYFERKKREKPYFSHRYFCKTAGFKTPSVIKLVIDGKRNLSRTSLIKVSRAIGLSTKEHEYFEALVLFNQAKEPDEKRELLFKLADLKGATSPTLIDKTKHTFYREWYHTIVRECIGIEELSQHPLNLSKRIRPYVSPEKITDSIRLLLELGLITKDKKGRLKITEQTISTESELDSEFVASFNREMLKLALQASLLYPRPEREISGVTLRISRDCYKEIKNRIVQFKKELLYLAAQDSNSDCIYQLNFQFFPFLTGD
jgi:uncharacterized protein (TIGR02147 family)